MMKLFLFYPALLLCCPIALFSQSQDLPDTVVLSRIMKEGMDNSHVMEILSMLTDVNGPRLTNSPGYVSAAEYAKKTLSSWQVENVHFDYWDQVFGRGWELKKFSLNNVEPIFWPVIAYPRAWSPGVKGTIRAEAVYLDVTDENDLVRYQGKLKGKIVLFTPPASITPSYKADAWRLSDSTLEVMSQAKASPPYHRRNGEPTEEQKLEYLKWDLCQKEGAAAILEASSRLEDDGTLEVSQAIVPYPRETPYGRRIQAWSGIVPKILPQVVVTAEHYNRMVREVENHLPVILELVLQTEFTPAQSGFNIIGEIPGTDLKDQVVMIGAHFDSWHSATGTTDNGAGSAVMLETMRILKSLGRKPRRTIRIALWGGEEEGLIGSRSYVKRKLGTSADESYPYDSIQLTAEGKQFSVYFNMDNGTGKYRGIYLQGNENVAPVFREWLKPFADKGSGTLTLRNTNGTDHLSFDAIGLPAFQFIQDPIEYGTRTHHTNMDLYDKAVSADLKHNAVMTAFFAWMAANRNELIPRK
jgi:carboxypeptidase Q